MPRLSLCMIARDEAELLPRCLESVRGLVDEIIVVDTGSQDATVEVARQFGAEIGHFDWCDDFSAARNSSLEFATGDWILVLDADEVMQPQSASALREAMGRREDAFLLPVENLTGSGSEAERQTVWLLRLFRNRPEIRFSGRVHEQVTESLEALKLGIGYCLAPIRHDGYLQTRIAERDKYDRNLKILNASLEAQPQDAYAWYQLGKTLLAMGRAADARAPLENSLNLLAAATQPETYAYYPMAFAHLASAREALDGKEAALEVLAGGIVRLPESAELRYRQGIYLRELGKNEDALGAFQAGFHLTSRAKAGDRNSLPGRLATAIGDLLLQRGACQEAIASYRKAIELSESHAHEPYLKLANALLHIEDLAGATQAYEEVVQRSPEQFGAQLALGTLRFEMGDMEAALRALEAADRLKPGMPDIHMLIGECKKRGSTLKS